METGRLLMFLLYDLLLLFYREASQGEKKEDFSSKRYTYRCMKAVRDAYRLIKSHMNESVYMCFIFICGSEQKLIGNSAAFSFMIDLSVVNRFHFHPDAV